MTERGSDPSSTDSLFGTGRADFRLVHGVYAGSLLAGFAATSAVAAGGSAASAAVAGTLGLGVGLVAGVATARRYDRSWGLGRSRRREWLLYAPALAFAIAAIGSVFGPVDGRVTTVAIAAVIVVVASGSLLGHAARNRYVSRVATDDPAARSRWTPRGSRRFDLVFVGLWGLLAVFNLVDGDWLFALVCMAIALGWAASSTNAGRLFAGGSEPLEARVHDAGLVRQRRYTASLVSWDEVRHARLRDGELVLDRGLFDVRLEVDDLEDADELYAAVERAMGVAEPAR